MNGGIYGGGLGGTMNGDYGHGHGHTGHNIQMIHMVLLRHPRFLDELSPSGVATFFGRVAMLIDQNTQAFHMFMSALLQLFNRSGMLYGELAKFVLRLLGIRTKPRQVHPGGPEGHGHHIAPHGENFIEGPKATPTGSWDNVWGSDVIKAM